MTEQNIYESELFQQCLKFHGHLCPGLSMGFLAATAGMAWLDSHRAEDEEIVTIVETDACGCDAVQVVTGCTFGKGNFIYRDYGKTAFTFFSRQTGSGVRIARKPEKQEFLDPEHRELMAKIRQGIASEQERRTFRAKHEAASHRILAMQPEELFTITALTVPLPEKARIEPSVNCARCNEPTMSTKMVDSGGEMICRGCLE
jgi:formylmethanofuran dehydrogenase subunit E